MPPPLSALAAGVGAGVGSLTVLPSNFSISSCDILPPPLSALAAGVGSLAVLPSNFSISSCDILPPLFSVVAAGVGSGSSPISSIGTPKAETNFLANLTGIIFINSLST